MGETILVTGCMVNVHYKRRKWVWLTWSPNWVSISMSCVTCLCGCTFMNVEAIHIQTDMLLIYFNFESGKQTKAHTQLTYTQQFTLKWCYKPLFQSASARIKCLEIQNIRSLISSPISLKIDTYRLYRESKFIRFS